MRRLAAFALLAGCTVDGWTWRPRDAALDAPPDASPDVADASLDAPPDVPPDAAPAAPRLLWPLSGARLTGRSPTLRWAAPDAAATLDHCADRACARVTDSTPVTGASHALRDLAPGPHWWRVRAGGRASAVWLFFAARQGPAVTRAAGVVPDFDADGRADLALGAGEFDGRGAVFVHPGAPGGVATSPAVTLRSPEGDALFGERMSCGDLDGDGFVDLAVAARRAGGGAGAVFVYRGGPTGLAATPAQRLDGPRGGEEFGFRLAAQGDRDGDGYADVAVARAFSNEITLGHGSPAGVRWGAGATAAVAADRACLGDLVVFDADEDGRDELGCAAAGNSTTRAGPSLQWFRGGGSPGVAPARGEPAQLPYAAGGETVADAVTAGDLDGDGRPEVVVTAANTVYVVPFAGGAPSGAGAVAHRHTGASTRWGERVAAGDLDGDGRAELLLGDPTSNLPAALDATVCRWRMGACVELTPTLHSQVAGAYVFGEALAALDLDGDGFDDAAVGGFGWTGAVLGRVELFRGGAMGPAAAPTATLGPPSAVQISYGESILR
ncbi:MAG: VCBS repeat-containing protein [Polyangiales bacterium]